MIQAYFTRIENALQSFANIRSYTIKKKIYSAGQGFISGYVTFDNDCTLDFAEVKDTGIRSKIKYRYQYMNEHREMIFRYDNAPHHRHLGTFPHHKHISDDVRESSEPDLEDILLEIAQAVRENT
jgi:hypothetical protein